MDWSAAYGYILIVLLWIMIICFALAMILLAGIIILICNKKDAGRTQAYLENIMIGVTGGIIAAMILELRSKPFNIFSYMLILSLAVLFAALMTGVSFINFSKLANKVLPKKRRLRTDSKRVL